MMIDDLPTLADREEILGESIEAVKREAYKLAVQAVYLRAQGLDAEGRREAEKLAVGVDQQRANILKGLEKLKQMLEELG